MIFTIVHGVLSCPQVPQCSGAHVRVSRLPTRHRLTSQRGRRGMRRKMIEFFLNFLEFSFSVFLFFFFFWWVQWVNAALWLDEHCGPVKHWRRTSYVFVLVPSWIKECKCRLSIEILVIPCGMKSSVVPHEWWLSTIDEVCMIHWSLLDQLMSMMIRSGLVIDLYTTRRQIWT